MLAVVLCVFGWFCHASASSGAYARELDASSHLNLKALPIYERRSHLPDRRDTIAALLRGRDTYSCSAADPCSNGACCGGSGFCGYGPTYCGTDCVSDCDAVAECGEYSSPANATCPLNVCCSQYGFCGTTEDFCTDGCQSNCVLTPTPPSGSPSNKTLSKVIGYYEAWNDYSSCHQTAPTDLPLDALTHINYAFAYIDPTSYEITTMDSTIEVSLFEDLANLKSTNPNIKIFISIGGWSFSDNDTTTQAVFGDIAASSTNRQTFATNVLAFLNTYGFDGVDIDWEYPGAPDRGGSPSDTKNYVALLKTLRETFDNSGATLGISFTTPSSYWYMRWYDLPGLLQYADWLNLMTYDLHGVWDSTDPAIGSIVQAHTNLTEIKLAVELLWRVNVDPSQVAMGFGFYGRAFTLSDSSCTDPGCPFSAGANPGPCTATSGYLAYYEIEAILANDSSINVIWDKEAAVKYFTWDSNQWISYDDVDTFAQKVDWANEVGISGSLIWASDLDDYTWTAHKALTGISDLGSELSLKESSTQQTLVDTVNSFFGADCYRFPEDVDLGNPLVSTCATGYTKVGYDENGCTSLGTTCGLPICCPTATAPTTCQWRGSGGDCNGQCHAGEVQLFASSWGGIPGESGTGRCSRGSKAFCCEVGTFADLTDGCYWTASCGKSCLASEQKIAHMYDRWGIATIFCNGNSYCCPGDEEPPFEDCHWVGQGDCAQNTCADTEITLLTDNRGDSYTGCSWWRNKALCCTPNDEVLTTLNCDLDLCTADPDLCLQDPDDQEDGIDSTDITKRSYYIGDNDSTLMYSYDAYEQSPHHIFDRATGGTKPASILKIGQILGTSIYGNLQLTLQPRPYPPNLKLLIGDGASTLTLKGGYSMLQDLCSSTAVTFTKAANLPTTGLNAEHLQEAQMIGKFLKSAITGVLPSGATFPSNLIIDPQKLVNIWNTAYDVSLPRIGAVVTDVSGWTAPVTPNDRWFEVIGSYAYRTGMSLLPGDMNGLKGRFFGLIQAQSLDNVFKPALVSAGQGSESAAKIILGTNQKVIGLWNYMNDIGLESAWTLSRATLAKEIGYTSTYMSGMTNLATIWALFEPDYYGTVTNAARSFITTRTDLINAYFAGGGTLDNPVVTQMLYEAAQLSNQIGRLVSPVD